MLRGMGVDYSKMAENSTGRVRFANRFAQRTLRGRRRGAAFGAGAFALAEVVAAGEAEAAAEAEAILKIAAEMEYAGDGEEEDQRPVRQR
jgi:hypothetical protein